MYKLNFSLKFYLGAAIIILSFIIGFITHFTIIIYFNQPTIRWVSIIAYILSWFMLALGVWWAGKEYAESLKKYFDYSFYHKNMEKGTKRAYRVVRRKTKQLKEKTKQNYQVAKRKTKDLKQKTKHQTKRLKEKTKHKTRKLKEKFKGNLKIIPIFR